MRDVYILSTVHDDRMADASASKRAHEKNKPLAVMDYNQYKIGVDKSNQLLAVCEVVRKIVLPPL
jgi:hypothetical protein